MYWRTRPSPLPAATSPRSSPTSDRSGWRSRPRPAPTRPRFDITPAGWPPSRPPTSKKKKHYVQGSNRQSPSACAFGLVRTDKGALPACVVLPEVEKTFNSRKKESDQKRLNFFSPVIPFFARKKSSIAIQSLSSKNNRTILFFFLPLNLVAVTGITSLLLNSLVRTLRFKFCRLSNFFQRVKSHSGGGKSTGGLVAFSGWWKKVFWSKDNSIKFPVKISSKSNLPSKKQKKVEEIEYLLQRVEFIFAAPTGLLFTTNRKQWSQNFFFLSS